MNRPAVISRPVLALLLGLFMGAAATVALGVYTLEQRAIRDTTQHLLEHIDVARAGSSLVHALQRERGLSFGRAGSTDGHFDTALEHQRALTDARIAQWLKKAAPFLAESPQLDRTADNLGSLEQIRSDIDDRLLPARLILDHYTGVNLALLNHISRLSAESTHTKTVRRLTSWHSLVMAKDLAGLERALVAHAYAADTMPGLMFRRYMQVLEQKYAYLDIFRANATPRLLEHSQNVLSSQVIDALQKERLWVMKNAGLPNALNRDPRVWFELISQRVDALGRLETVVVEELEALIDARNTRARYLMNRCAFGVAAGLVFMGALLLRLVRRARRQALTEAPRLSLSHGRR
ncbi:nitrate- and nitrite sensing domain-containing protein [Larsenimonas suaedae]|uniref:Nitrate- and nitrite sensing domain-containing protein n=1 Tax=Larsenimonas suaedae TaxID=1851019 RepID=A0ABU1GSI4_9GAMM|nr:nitrate- and nitrite sensing domain-containing protein [Larsenimonas suaedae]MCM2972228.1 nitrate- and nitrite sensing domain-containing protein [Larsenimonas suaedae]MDR5894976.1 nitrate- and nitrite sensing domain-containing protein [Larsenimonas suaedae]